MNNWETSGLKLPKECREGNKNNKVGLIIASKTIFTQI